MPPSPSPSPALSFTGNGDARNASKAPAPGKGGLQTIQSPTMSLRSTAQPGSSSHPDPDQLFEKYTVQEVRVVQQRLRAEAEAKQEELRIMVWRRERYRDLLQASTSIISMAQSSKRVMKALEEAKTAILSQEQPFAQKRHAVVQKDDAHLRTMQVLSAHVKLLLDAPEHLWRLLERKNFYQAAWLFLLARVVHHALVRDDDQDEDGWSEQGVDIWEQFPLVQRQWDTVSHFRSQIIHKATYSLREVSSSSEEICASLLTLHLLDSRPLGETLTTLLSQRSRKIHNLLSWKSETPTKIGVPPVTKRMNGHARENSIDITQQPGGEKTSLREVKEAARNALEALFKTVTSARHIFQQTDSEQSSMIRRVLEFIQSESADDHSTSDGLPQELQLTTQTLLTSLPSSTHFQLLPPSLKFYKPYIDLNSTSSSLSQSFLADHLRDWLQKTTSEFQKALESWLSGFRTAKGIWKTRSSTRQAVLSSPGLTDIEKGDLNSAFDDVYRQRVISIWKDTLLDAERVFQENVQSALKALIVDSDAAGSDISPVEFMFQTPALPTTALASSSPVGTDVTFQDYKSALRQRILGRTSLVDGLLSTLETCARSLQRDLSLVTAGDAENSTDVHKPFQEPYQPAAEALCSGILSCLNSVVALNDEEAPENINKLILVGRTANALASSSSFITSIGCGEKAAKRFRTEARVLHDQIIDRWREYTVDRLVHEHQPTRHRSQQGSPLLTFKPKAPSSCLIQSLLGLSSSIQNICISLGQSQQQTIASHTLFAFVQRLLEAVNDSREPTDNTSQSLWDMVFLRRLAGLWGGAGSHAVALLDERTKILGEQAGVVNLSDIEKRSLDYLARAQVLLANLVPPLPPSPTNAKSNDNSALLLPLPLPPSEQQFYPALDLAKPSPRFGLLLVGSTI